MIDFLYNAYWQEATSYILSVVQKNWLLANGSLTKRLKQDCPDLVVQVIQQEEMAITEAESQYLNMDGTCKVKVRDVFLMCKSQPWVFARSLFPLSLIACHHPLATLGNSPLGELLFSKSAQSRRNSLQLATFLQDSTLANLVVNLGQKVVEPLWGRRSRFLLHNYPLSVAEVFLPACPLYQEKS